MSVDITFFVPCYNEADNIEDSLEMIRSVMRERTDSYEILVVDDGSSDGTSSVVQAYQRAHPELPITLHRNEVNLGLGRNYFLWAKHAEGRYYMLINGDNSLLATDLQTILNQRGRADMIVPYVVNQNDRPLIRNLLSRFYSFLISLVSGHRLKYYNGPVLHLRENIVRFEPKASGFAYQAEILCRALHEGYSYIEIPLHYVKKDKSRSSAFRLTNIASVLKSLSRMGIRQCYPFLIFLSLLFIFFPDVLFGGKVFIRRGGDFHLATYSFATYFKETMEGGVLPFWNSLNFCGVPFNADSFSNVSITNLLALFLKDANAAWNVAILGNVFLAAAFTYAYMRRIGLPIFPGLLGGLIFALTPSGGAFVDSWGFFLPMSLWATEKFRATKKIAHLMTAFWAFFLLFLNALPQYSLYAGIFFAAYTLYRFRSPLGIAILIFSFGAVSFHTFRMFEALSLSPRPPLWFVNVLLPTHLINMIFPFFFESPFRLENNFFFAKGFYALTRTVFGTDTIQYITPPYIGVLGFTFSIFAWKAKGVARFYLWAIVAILAYMMTYPFLAPLYKQIPVLGQLPRIARLECVFTFCLAILAGFGARRFLIEKINPKPVLLFLGVLSGSIIVLLSAIRLFFHFQAEAVRSFLTHYIQTHIVGNPPYQAPPEFYLARIDDFFRFVKEWTSWWGPSLAVSLGFVALTCLLIYVAWQRKRSQRLFQSLCFFLLALDLLLYFRFTQYAVSHSQELKVNSQVIDLLKRDREPYRIMPILTGAQYGVGRVRGVLAPNANLLYGLASVEGWNPFMSKRYATFFKNFQTQYDTDPALIMGGAEGDFDYRMTDFLNVKYFLAPPKMKLKRRMQVLAQDPYYQLLANPSYIPRAFLVREFRVLKEDERILAYLKSRKMAFDQMVVLEEQPAPFPRMRAVGSAQDAIQIQTYGPHNVRIWVRATRPAFLVLSETYYPGWKATIDGNDTQILRANYAFRAVQVPAGEHVIDFLYQPASFRWGLVTSIAFFILWLFVRRLFIRKQVIPLKASGAINQKVPSPFEVQTA